MDRDRNGESMNKEVNAANFRDTAPGSSVPEAPQWRLALAVTLIVLCSLIGLVIGVCG